jgi:DNA-directed RNA polymerase specialized sigma24 family protein
LSTFNPKKAPIGTWILSVARNVVRDHRRNQRRWTWLPLGTVWNRASPDPTPETGALERERHQQLLGARRGGGERQALDELAPGHPAVIEIVE